MLILSRKENQKIRIGSNIILNVISISESNVRIGIEADKEVKIYREEIYDSIKEHTKEATTNVQELLPDDIKKLKFNKINKNVKKK